MKIGYADDVEKRVQELNRTECTPFAFRVYTTYEVGSRLKDKNLHAIIDTLNPNLRSRDNLNGRERVREFYQMSAEDVYAILKAMSLIHDCEDKLKIIPSSAEENIEADTAETKRAQNFTFKLCGIEIGEEIEFCNPADEKPGQTFKVVDDKYVEYQGKSLSLSVLAAELQEVNLLPILVTSNIKENGLTTSEIESDFKFIK